MIELITISPETQDISFDGKEVITTLVKFEISPTNEGKLTVKFWKDILVEQRGKRYHADKITLTLENLKLLETS